MISYKKALNKLIRFKISTKSEAIISTDSLNRVCSENVYSSFNYPAADNTALDGFAINSSESDKASRNNQIKLKIIKTVAAGDNPYIKKNFKFSCVEVMTGAIIKKPFNTIIPYEKSKVIIKKKIKYLLIDRKIHKLNNLRFAGSDIKK